MREIKTVMVETKKIGKLICNNCGCEQLPDDIMGGHEIHSFDIEFGYSSHADGTELSFDLCSRCIQKIVDGFKIPALVNDRVDYSDEEEDMDDGYDEDLAIENEPVREVVKEVEKELNINVDGLGAEIATYAVFRGRIQGLYQNWGKCKVQVDGYEGAKYKKYDNLKLAIEAMKNFLSDNPEDYSAKPQKSNQVLRPTAGLSVDGAFSSSTLLGQYQCVDIDTGKNVFRSKKYKGGSNNLMEFIGLVEAIKYVVDQKLKVDIYCDSQTAISWLEKRRVTTTIKKTKDSEEVFKKLEESERYVISLKFLPKIKKWDTAKWGEIPADFGNK